MVVAWHAMMRSFGNPAISGCPAVVKKRSHLSSSSVRVSGRLPSREFATNSDFNQKSPEHGLLQTLCTIAGLAILCEEIPLIGPILNELP